MAKKQSGSKGNKKAGRALVKCEAYQRVGTRVKNKLPRVLQSCGEPFARSWAKQHSLTDRLEKLLRKAS